MREKSVEAATRRFCTLLLKFERGHWIGWRSFGFGLIYKTLFPLNIEWKKMAKWTDMCCT